MVAKHAGTDRRPTAAAPMIERSVELPPPAATLHSASADAAGAESIEQPRSRPWKTTSAPPSRPRVANRRWNEPGGRRVVVRARRRIEPALPARPRSPRKASQYRTLRLELHAFSAQPRDRFVFINGRKYVEGDRLAEGPQLVSIEPTGAVLTQYGQRTCSHRSDRHVALTCVAGQRRNQRLVVVARVVDSQTHGVNV